MRNTDAMIPKIIAKSESNESFFLLALSTPDSARNFLSRMSEVTKNTTVVTVPAMNRGLNAGCAATLDI
jgi:hypothetical protein